MIAFVEQLTRTGAGQVTREQARTVAAKSQPKVGRPKAFVFQYRPQTKAFNLKLQFRKADVDRSEVIAALEGDHLGASSAAVGLALATSRSERSAHAIVRGWSICGHSAICI